MGEVIRSALRILTFQATRDDLIALDNRHLKFGLVCTWVVGVGRWWDDSTANFAQRLGLGSVIYVIVLTAFIGLLIRPLSPKELNFTRLLTFVSLTSIPGIMYAVPIERWVELETARVANAIVLVAVLLWRVGMLTMYLYRVSQFKWARLVVALLLPLCGIVTALTLLNPEQATYVAASETQTNATSDDWVDWILYTLTFYTVVALPPLFGSYFLILYLDARSFARTVTPFRRPKS